MTGLRKGNGMSGRDFYTKIDKHEKLNWLGSKEGATPAEDRVLVSNTSGAKFSVAVSAILDHSWDELEAVLLGKRPPRVMTHVTRIVGYYSMIQNWNRSKIAELHDRHKGDYAVPKNLPPMDVSSSSGVALAS